MRKFVFVSGNMGKGPGNRAGFILLTIVGLLLALLSFAFIAVAAVVLIPIGLIAAVPVYFMMKRQAKKINKKEVNQDGIIDVEASEIIEDDSRLLK